MASIVWKYFEKTQDKEYAKCKLCNSLLKCCGSSTSNMKKHLDGKHNDSLSNEQSKLPSIFNFTTPTKCKLPAERVTNFVTNMVVEDCMPMKMVDGQGFNKLMNYITPGYQVPCANTIQNRIMKLYDTKRQSLKDIIGGETCSLTADHWTSNSNDPFLTITGHYIDSDWKMHNSVLEIMKTTERHTKEHIANDLRKCSSDWDIKVISLVHDNAKNMVGAARINYDDINIDEWNSVPCSAHTIQLAIKPLFEIPEIRDLSTRASKLVTHFNHSVVATQALAERQSHKLMQDCPTRWNSTYYMLDRLQESRRAVTDVLLDSSVSKPSDKKLLLREDEWDLLEEVLPILHPLELATKALSADKYVSVSIVYPILLGILSNHLKIDKDDSSVIKKAKSVVRDALVVRFKTNTDNICKTLPLLASALDPRFKKLNFLSPQQRDTLFNELEERLPLGITNVENEPPAKKRKISALSSLIGKKPTVSHVSTELEQYKGLPEEDEDCDPLNWWKVRSKTMPNLGKLAKSYLATPATSTPAERVFSHMGLIITKLRNRLSPSTAGAILFLKQNNFEDFKKYDVNDL